MTACVQTCSTAADEKDTCLGTINSSSSSNIISSGVRGAIISSSSSSGTRGVYEGRRFAPHPLKCRTATVRATTTPTMTQRLHHHHQQQQQQQQHRSLRQPTCRRPDSFPSCPTNGTARLTTRALKFSAICPTWLSTTQCAVMGPDIAHAFAVLLHLCLPCCCICVCRAIASVFALLLHLRLRVE